MRFRHGVWPDELVFLDTRFAALPSDPAAGYPDALVVPDEPALVDLLRAELVGHLQPLLTALSRRSGRSERALWRTVADRAAAAFLFAGEATATRHATSRLAERLLAGPPPLRGRPRYEMLDGPDGPMPVHLRTGCCLWWRTRAARCCLTCPLADRRGQRQR